MLQPLAVYGSNNGSKKRSARHTEIDIVFFCLCACLFAPRVARGRSVFEASHSRAFERCSLAAIVRQSADAKSCCNASLFNAAAPRDAMKGMTGPNHCGLLLKCHETLKVRQKNAKERTKRNGIQRRETKLHLRNNLKSF